MLQEGQYYLFACPWDWTFVGRFVRQANLHFEIDNSIYFTYTGATFDVLCRTGLVLTGDKKSHIHGGPQYIDVLGTKIWRWNAATPWAKGK